jgi:hypothetical protein
MAFAFFDEGPLCIVRVFLPAMPRDQEFKIGCVELEPIVRPAVVAAPAASRRNRSEGDAS